MTTTQLSPLLNPAETAQLLGVTTGTLAVWRSTRRYPLAYVRIGGRIKYRVVDIETFQQLRRVEPRKK